MQGAGRCENELKRGRGSCGPKIGRDIELPDSPMMHLENGQLRGEVYPPAHPEKTVGEHRILVETGSHDRLRLKY